MAIHDHIDAAIEDEFRAARDALVAAKARYAAAAAAREQAHLDAEFARSQEAQRLARLSDAEWDALRQRVRNGAGPVIVPDLPAQGA